MGIRENPFIATRAPESERDQAATFWTRGDVVLYRLFDVGYEIDLERASELLAPSGPARVKPVRGEAQAIRIANPPVTVRLWRATVSVASEVREVEVSARIFDFGVVSLRARLPVADRCAWDDFVQWSSEINAAAEWPAHFVEWRNQLLQRIRPSIQRPGDTGVAEDYTVFRIRRLEDGEGRALPVSVLSDQQVASLLLGERRPLSEATRKDLLSQGFSYYEDDLAVLAWNAALVVEPSPDDEDVQYILEFANAQLLELRYYDALLDGQIPRMYAEIAEARRAIKGMGRRYGHVLGRLHARFADATELIERVENSLKLTEDVFLARVYAAALEVFRGRTWRQGIERKLAILKDAYSMLDAESQAHRATVLEITIIVLIAVEIVLATLRNG